MKGMKNMARKRNESGAVSLFVVIFAMLLITIVTVGFIRIMTGEVRQASDTDLSRSAYDSALAGVEDAKRALIRYEAECLKGSAACAAARTVINNTACNGSLASINAASAVNNKYPEVKVQRSTSTSDNNSLDQAYTCVTVTSDTADFVGERQPEGKSKLVPLVGTSAFSRVQVKWFSKEDMTTKVNNVALTNSTTKTLPPKGDWQDNKPAILRTQLIQYGTDFELTEFDYVKSGASNTNTLFLYPTSNGINALNEPYASKQTISFTGRDIRKSSPTGKPEADTANSSPLDVACESSLNGPTYACTAILVLPGPVDGGARTAFLRLTPFYKATSFQVVLQTAAGATVNFKGVQPMVDSTGRANDMFRRVQSRVELGDTTFPYPEAAVDVTTEFCKDFMLAPTFINGTCNYSN